MDLFGLPAHMTLDYASLLLSAAAVDREEKKVSTQRARGMLVCKATHTSFRVAKFFDNLLSPLILGLFSPTNSLECVLR